MFYTLLNAMTCSMFFVGAMLAARQAKGGVIGYSLAITIGLLLATCNAWGVNKLMEILAHYTGSYSETQQKWLGDVFVLLVFLWLPVAAFLGYLVASAVLRLVA
jgi:predicted permease